MQQAEDFRQESRILAQVLEPLAEADFFQPTQFKGWTIDDVLGHLHIFNHAAALALEDGDTFDAFFATLSKRMMAGQSLLEAQYPWLDGLKGRALFEAWRKLSEKIADDFALADPKARLRWAGPTMSARSSITARQMETGPMGNEVFDLLGKTRDESDRIRNIVVLGGEHLWLDLSSAQMGRACADALSGIDGTERSGLDLWRGYVGQSDHGIGRGICAGGHANAELGGYGSGGGRASGADLDGKRPVFCRWGGATPGKGSAICCGVRQRPRIGSGAAFRFGESAVSDPAWAGLRGLYRQWLCAVWLWSGAAVDAG